jgi:hypothetical protein
MEVPTDVGNAALEDPLGEEQSVSEVSWKSLEILDYKQNTIVEDVGIAGYVKMLTLLRRRPCTRMRRTSSSSNLWPLTTTRPTAKCILDQQCRKLSKNPEDVWTTLKTFKKLFDNGHMVLLKDIPQEPRKKFINKPVHHHLYWRVVYNTKSTSTPVRPVMDASTKTPGGRCLNDLAVKGRISSLS